MSKKKYKEKQKRRQIINSKNCMGETVLSRDIKRFLTEDIMKNLCY